MGYASSSDIGILCPHLLACGSSSGSDFSASTTPTLNAVNAFISSGSNVIDTRLASKGYDSIPNTSIAYGMAREANAFYGAYLAERSLLSARVSKMENSRADFFKKDFNDTLEMLVNLDLSNAGVGRSLAPKSPYTGGISETDKDNQQDNLDRVPPRFSRGFATNPETTRPNNAPSDKQSRQDI